MEIIKSIRNGTTLLSLYRHFNRRKYTVTESDNLIGLYMRLVCYEKVRDKYKYVLESHVRAEAKAQHPSNIIWVSWFQGIENAPELVKKCYENLVATFPDRKIVLITEENFRDYIDIPEWFMDKWKNGIIDSTKLSNLIRLELLIKYGGLWVDATVFFSSYNLPDYIFDVPLFMYSENGIGDIRMGATWLISAYSNNNILRATRDVYLEYWKNEDSLIEYFLITFCIKMAAEKYPDEWAKMPKIPAINQTMFASEMFNPYDKNRWSQLKQLTPVHKLSFKENAEGYDRRGTFYEVVVKEGNI